MAWGTKISICNVAARAFIKTGLGLCGKIDHVPKNAANVFPPDYIASTAGVSRATGNRFLPNIR